MNIFNVIKMKAPVVLAGFNEGAAKSFVKSYTDPLTNFLLWAVPITGIIAAVVSGIIYLLKDEEERDRKKLSKDLKRILFTCIILESITVIFKIVGITTG